MSLQRSSASFDQSTHQPAIEAVEACTGSDMTTRLSFLRWVSAALVAASPAVAGVSAHAATAGPLHISFRPSGTVAPTGYTADFGGAFNGTSGWQTLTGAPLDLT